MTLEDLMNIVPETQDMEIHCGALSLRGEQDAMMSMLSVEILNTRVVNAEAQGGYLSVWLKDGEANER